MAFEIFTFTIQAYNLTIKCRGGYYRGYNGWNSPPEPESFDFYDVTLNGADVWPLLGEEQRNELERLCIERVHECRERREERAE